MVHTYIQKLWSFAPFDKRRIIGFGYYFAVWRYVVRGFEPIQLWHCKQDPKTECFI